MEGARGRCPTKKLGMTFSMTETTAIKIEHRISGELHEAARVAQHGLAHALSDRLLFIQHRHRDLDDARPAGERLNEGFLNVVIVERRAHQVEHAAVHAAESA